MSAIFKKEFRSYFPSPIGWVVLAIMFFFSGFYFFMYNMSYGVANLTYVFQGMYSIITLLVLPVLTMRLFSEEKRQKTDQALFTAPTSLTGIVLGKYCAAMLLYALGLAITLVFAVILAFQVDPGWLSVFGNLIGTLLLGGMIVSIGVLITALAGSQLVAAISTFGISYMLLSIDNLASIFQNVSWVTKVVSFLSINARYYNFTTGLIRVPDLIFFLSIQAMFIFLTIRVLERKRWN